MNTTPTSTDWRRWYARWETQQKRYMPDREERFGVITGTVVAFCGDSPHCHRPRLRPGSLAQRILGALPSARVTAIDMDAVLLAIGRNALGDQGGRLRFVDADLRDHWESRLHAGVDPAVSTTALHWLQAGALAGFYEQLASVIRSGGVFVDGDHLAFGATHRRRRARHARAAGAACGGLRRGR
jgi:hypothetical protein